MRSVSPLLLPLLLSAAGLLGPAPAPATGGPVRFEFDLEKEGPTSAGVYGPDGRSVRGLWSLRTLPAGRHAEQWDGRDDLGRNVPPGAYEVRIARGGGGGAAYASVGTIGNSGVGKPMQAGTDDLIVDRTTGEIYAATNWEEAGQDFRKTDADGRHLMDAKFGIRNGTPNGFAIAAALDAGVLYCSVFTTQEVPPGAEKATAGGAVIRKFSAETGEPLPFPTEGGYVRVKWPDPGSVDPFALQSLKSLAVAGDALVAADRATGKVHVFDKNSGKPIGGFALSRPASLAVDGAKRLWVAHDGNRVSVLDLGGRVLAEPRVDAGEIAAIRLGPGNRLWVADQKAGQVRVYERGEGDRLAPVRNFGHKARPGESGPLAIGRIQSFDVMPDGGFVLAQTYGHGSVVTRFTPDGEVVWQQVGLEFCTNGTYHQSSPDLFISSLTNAYRLLDRETGTWRFEGSLYDGALRPGQSTGTPRIIEREGRKYYYSLSGEQVRVFRLGDGGRVMRASAVLDIKPTPQSWPQSWPLELTGQVQEKIGQSVWHDADGDGHIERDEIAPITRPRTQVATFSVEVDERGNLILPNHHDNVIYTLPLEAFDPHGNPVYDWDLIRPLIARDETLRNLRPMKACPLPGGGMYVLQQADPSLHPPVDRQTPFGRPHETVWMGGWVYSKYDKAGRRLFTVPLPDHCTGLDFVPDLGRTAERGLVVGSYTGKQLFHYSPDGLLLGELSPKHETGWLDHNGSVSINRDPRDGRVDLFAEESYSNRISWYRLDDSAVRTLTVAVTKEPAEGETYSDEAQLLGLLQTAKEKLAAGQPAAAVAALEQARDGAAERERPHLHQRLARAYAANGQPDRAAEQYGIVADSPAFDARQKSEALFLMARLQQQQKKFDDARATLRRVTQMPLPAEWHVAPQAMIQLAETYAAEGKPDEALRQYGRVKAHFRDGAQPHHPALLTQAYVASGDLLRRQGKPAEAIKEYEQSRQVTDADAHSMAWSEIYIGECRVALGDRGAAERHFVAAAERYPQADVSVKVHGLLLAGDCRAQAGDKEAARAFYKRARDLPGTSAEQKQQAEQRFREAAAAVAGPEGDPTAHGAPRAGSGSV